VDAPIFDAPAMDAAVVASALVASAATGKADSNADVLGALVTDRIHTASGDSSDTPSTTDTDTDTAPFETDQADKAPAVVVAVGVAWGSAIQVEVPGVNCAADDTARCDSSYVQTVGAHGHRTDTARSQHGHVTPTHPTARHIAQAVSLRAAGQYATAMHDMAPPMPKVAEQPVTPATPVTAGDTDTTSDPIGARPGTVAMVTETEPGCGQASGAAHVSPTQASSTQAQHMHSTERTLNQGMDPHHQDRPSVFDTDSEDSDDDDDDPGSGGANRHVAAKVPAVPAAAKVVHQDPASPASPTKEDGTAVETIRLTTGEVR